VTGGAAPERPPLWLVAAAAAVRVPLLAVALLHPERWLRGDCRNYLDLAWSLRSAHAFALGSPLSPQTYRTPGYPLLLSLLTFFPGSAARWAAVFQSAMGVGAAILLWRWLRRLTDERSATLGALVLALDPVLLFHTPLLLTETLFLGLILLAALATAESWEDARRGLAARAGLLWAAAAFVRPVSLYWPAALAWGYRKRPRALAAFLAAAFVAPAAWALRNHAQTGHLVFSSIADDNLLRYPAASVEAMATGQSWSSWDERLRAEVERSHPDGFATEAARAAAYGARARPILSAHPFLLARHCVVGAVKTLAGTGLEMLVEWTSGETQPGADAEYKTGVSGGGTLALLKRHPALIPLQLAYMAALAGLYLAAGLGVGRLLKEEKGERLLLLAGSAGYFLLMASSQGYYRYRIPMLPFLAALAAFGIQSGKKPALKRPAPPDSYDSYKRR